MATTDDLVISLRADVSQLQKGLEQVNDQLLATQGVSIATTQAMSSGFSRAANAALFLKAAIVAATAAAATLFTTVTNGVREFNSLANSLNLTYNQLARLQSVSEGANLETDMMIDLAKTLNEQIGEAANGNKDFEESFARLGLSMDTLLKMGVDEQLLVVADALGNVTSQADKAQIGATLFGDNWLPALKLTEVNVKGLADEFDKLLPKINDLDVSRAIEADKEFDKLIANLRTTTESITSQLSPAFTVATRNLNALFNVDPGELNDNISFITFASIELGAQLINLMAILGGDLKIIAATAGTIGNIIIMGVGAPIAFIMDVYRVNVTALTNAMIKAENVANRIRGLPQIDLIPIGSKTEAFDAVMAKVKETKAAIKDLAKEGAAQFTSGMTGKAGANYKDEAIKEAMELKNKNKTSDPTTGKKKGDDGEAAKAAKQAADERRKAALELLNQTKEANLSEIELQEKHYNELLAQLDQYRKDGALTRAEHQAGVLDANEAFAAKINQRALEHAEKLKAINDQIAKDEAEQQARRLEQMGVFIDGVRQNGMTELESLDENHAQKMKKVEELRAANEAARGVNEQLVKDLEANYQVERVGADYSGLGEAELAAMDALHVQKMEKLAEQNAAMAEAQALVDQAKIDAEAQYQAKRLDLILGTGNQIQDMNKAFQKGNLQGALAFFAADFGGMSQHSRKMFELTKAARLAEAAIAIPSTVIDAYKAGTATGGPVLGAAYGAAALAAQLAQLRNIQAASFGGGSAGGGGGGGASAGVSSAASAPQQQQPITQRFVNLNIQGDENSMFSRDSVLKLMERMGEEVKDGAVLRIV